MKRLFFIILVLITSSVCQAQYLAAFNDQQNQFWAFEAGTFSQLEDDEVMEYQVGGTLIAYLDQSSNFKIYQFGEVQTFIEVAQVEFTTTDFLLGYSLFDTLFVYDNEKITRLSSDCESYIVKDSIIIWQTRSDKELKAYYKGKTTTIAEGLYDFKFEPHMAGDNLFAFIDPSTKEFEMFYRGQLKVLDSYAEEVSFQVGCDLIAYTDDRDQSFNVFYNGEVLDLDLFLPKSFQVGDKIIAYVDDLENLNYFENGQVQTISSQPDFYEVKDHVLVYGELGSFKTVCNGEVYIIEQYIPQPYYLDVNTIAYLEHNESIRVFQHCNHIVANKVDVLKFSMVRNVIVYSESENEVKVFFNGEVYEH